MYSHVRDPLRINWRQRTRHYSRDRSWICDRARGAFRGPDLWRIDESGPFVRAGINIATVFGAVDLSACACYWRHARSRRLPLCSRERVLLGYADTETLLNDQIEIMKKKVLFICIHNSARSQMAEAFLNHTCPDYFEAHSAGLEPGTLNPLAVEAMHEVGIDISGNKTQSVFDVFKSGQFFPYVITVCDETSAERCPIFPGVTQRLHWSFPDPAALRGTHEERLEGVRKIRDQIRARIEMWCDEMCAVET